jgi:hypothetical protein
VNGNAKSRILKSFQSRNQLQYADNFQNIQSESDQKYFQGRILEYKRRSAQAKMKLIEEMMNEMLSQKYNE